MCPSGWHEIIERLHAKDPASAFGSAREVALVLEQNLAAVQLGLPVAANPPARPRQRAEPAGPKDCDRRGALNLGMRAGRGCLRAKDRRLCEPIRPIFPAALGDGQGAAAAGGGEPGCESRSIESSQSKTIVGSGKLATKTWDLADFSRVQIRSTFHAKISKGKTFKVTTTADDNVLPYVEVEKEGDLLKIGLEERPELQTEKSPEAEIVLPALAGIDLSGASTGHLEGFDSEKDVAIHLSGASKLDGSLGSAKAKIDDQRCQLVDLDGRSASGRAVTAAARAILCCPSSPSSKASSI